MSADGQNGEVVAIPVRPRRQGGPFGPKPKDPKRVEAMRKLNREGRAGPGGRRPVHGRHALAELVRRGLEDGPDALSVLHREMVNDYLADLGGPEKVSAMDLGLVKRLVAADLDMALLLAMRDGVKKMSREKLLTLSVAINKNSMTYSQLVKTLGGPHRRPSETKGEIVVRRFSEEKVADLEVERGSV